MTQSLEARVHDERDGSFPALAIDQLAIGEQLLIWALRNRLAEGPERALAKGFHVAFGLSMVEPALASFHGLYQTLRDHCRRDLGFHGPRCRSVSSDEIIIVSLIAASQAGMTAHAGAIARYLVHPQALSDLIDGAGCLAMLLRQKELKLPLHPLVSYGEATCATAQPSRLH
ncbi:MAG: hypothetical protein R3F54_25260 [Alphaproteobacteria bacterium]